MAQWTFLEAVDLQLIQLFFRGFVIWYYSNCSFIVSNDFDNTFRAEGQG